MNVTTASLSPENEAFVNNSLQSGNFRNWEELVNEAIDLLKKREQLRKDVKAGFDQLSRGEGISFDAEELKALGRTWQLS